MSDQRFVLTDRATGKFVAIDSASGGYPYLVEDLFRAHLWSSASEAIHYTAVMSFEDYKNPLYTLSEVTYTLSDIPVPAGYDLLAYRG